MPRTGLEPVTRGFSVRSVHKLDFQPDYTPKTWKYVTVTKGLGFTVRLLQVAEMLDQRGKHILHTDERA